MDLMPTAAYPLQHAFQAAKSCCYGNAYPLQHAFQLYKADYLTREFLSQVLS